MNITEQQRENLKTLAEGLLTLPKDYTHFDMDAFYVGDSEPVLRPNKVYNESMPCGTVACAAGHGPMFGIQPTQEQIDMLVKNSIPLSWRVYEALCFTGDDIEFSERFSESVWARGDIDLFDWCFGSTWTVCDNTPHGAAKRILYALKEGIPEDYHEIISKKRPYPWETEEDYKKRVKEYEL